MTQRTLALVIVTAVGLAGGSLLAVGCGSAPESESPLPEAAPADAGATATGNVEIVFRSEPDPPTTGENTFEVVVTGPEGMPITDAEVSARFYMAAMPAIKMPEMETTAALVHDGDGRYRGNGQVMMAGTWEVTVTATRDGQPIGSKTLEVVAE
jgi:Cu(I)/Ag(I) efflux system membrane fusion protein/cobalt-zinc-cadmium efflux system membrane fusion protein